EGREEGEACEGREAGQGAEARGPGEGAGEGPGEAEGREAEGPEARGRPGEGQGLMIGRITNLFRVPEIRTRLWVTLVFLAVYRVGANVPIPGVSMPLFKHIMHGKEEGSQIVVMLNMLSGGGVGAGTLFSLGIMPYI